MTDRRRAEEALRASEERYRAVYDDTPSMYFTLDPSGTVRSVNEFGAAQLGYAPAELVGRSVLQVFPEGEWPGVRQHLEECLAHPERMFHWEARKTRKDGSLLWVKETARAVRGPQGDLVVLIVCLDITERRQAEEHLQRERRLFMGGPVVVFRRLAQPGWPVEYVSPNVASVFGHSAEDFMGGRVAYADVIYPGDLKRVSREVSNYSHERVARFQQHYRVVRPDHEVRWLDDFTVVARDENGQVTHYEGYVLDVTHRKRAEEKLREAEEQYREIFENAVEGVHQCPGGPGSVGRGGVLRGHCRGHHRAQALRGGGGQAAGVPPP